jgi:hypothetical protein
MPVPIGTSAAYRPPADSPAVRAAAPVGQLRCLRGRHIRALAHLELFAHGRTVVVPAGIGIAPPLVRNGAYVARGSCSYAVRTKAPTGIIEFVQSRRPTLRDFFAVWGQPLSPTRLGAFHGRPVRAWVGGHRWSGDVRSIPLLHHVQIVLELGTFVPPHPFFLFPR